QPADIRYNLGYLPGGDKTITTLADHTVDSLQCAVKLIKPGGIVSILCYPGHTEGKTETERVRSFATELGEVLSLLQTISQRYSIDGTDSQQWRVFEHKPLNRPTSPVLITLY